jgi:glycine cleavage system H protein
MTPNDRKYTSTHEWAKIDGELAVIGITEHAQEALGDITFIELPKPGFKVEKGRECGVIESVKAASDIYSPVSGEVAEVNTSLETSPEIVNKSPWDDGWLFKVKAIRHDEVETMLDASGYEQVLENRE